MTTKQHIRALKKYVDDITGADELKLSILEWLWDNRLVIVTPALQDEKFQRDIGIFKQLIEAGE